MWQWIDDNYGPMGWFSDEDKDEVEAELDNGHFRLVPQEEVDDFNKWLGHLSYTQS